MSPCEQTFLSLSSSSLMESFCSSVIRSFVAMNLKRLIDTSDMFCATEKDRCWSCSWIGENRKVMCDVDQHLNKTNKPQWTNAPPTSVNSNNRRSLQQEVKEDQYI